MKTIYVLKSAVLSIVLQIFLPGMEANAVVANCYRVLGLKPQTIQVLSNEQKHGLQRTPIDLSPSNNDAILSMECFLSLAKMLSKENYEILLQYWQNGSTKSMDNFLLNYDYLDETMEFHRYPYYEYGQALYTVIASRISIYFLPASPKAYLVFEETPKGKQMVGVAIELTELTSLWNYHADAYNEQIKGRKSEYDCLSLKNVEEWTVLASYLRLPKSDIAEIGIRNTTKEISSLRYSGAFQDRDYNENTCLTSDNIFTLSCLCDAIKLREMEAKIRANTKSIEQILKDAFSAFQALDGMNSSYEKFVYGILIHS